MGQYGNSPRIQADLKSSEGMNVPKRTADSVLTCSKCGQAHFAFAEVDLGNVQVNWQLKSLDSPETMGDRECSLPQFK